MSLTAVLSMSNGVMQRLNRLLDAMICDFQSGHFERIVAHYDFPLALHLEGRLVLMSRPADLEQYLVCFRAAAEAARQVRIEPHVIAVEIPRRGRFRAWVRYAHHDAQGNLIAQSERTFFCRDKGDRILVEMLELTRLPVDTLRDWQPEMRLTA